MHGPMLNAGLSNAVVCGGFLLICRRRGDFADVEVGYDGTESGFLPNLERGKGVGGRLMTKYWRGWLHRRGAWRI